MSWEEGHTEQLSRATAEVGGCRLVVIEGPDKGKEFDLSEEVALVGTSEQCELVLTDTAVSGHHIRVEVVRDGIEVSDLDSTNGTFYLGTRIQSAVVSHGAVLKLGRTKISISSRQPPASDAYSTRTSYGAVIGASPTMRRLYALLERIQKVDYGILLQGETGVGKDLVAREIHRQSPRAAKPYEVLDCGAVPAELAESELFGHVRGAFTGAVSNHDGVFARAAGGTVFLDEIGELPLELQPKLLRVLESRQFRPVGGQQVYNADVRVVAATNRDLADCVKDGTFREDLYFRLNVVTVWVPPLRERREDIPELVRHFLSDMGCAEVDISADTLELFTSGYDWPGNVRELRHAIARVVSLGTLPEDLDPSNVSRGSEDTDQSIDLDEPFLEAKKRLVDMFERDYLSSQLERSDNNIAKAARLSGMDRSYFKRLLKRHGLLGRK